MKAIKYLSIINLLCLLFSKSLLGYSFSTPLAPGPKIKDNYLGILLGFGQNIQNGISVVDCGNCQFEDGLGFGYTFGFGYEKQVALEDDNKFLSNVFYGAMLHLSNRNFSSSYRAIEQQDFPEYNVSFPVMYRQTNEINIMTAGLMPYVSYNPIKYLFVRFGVDASVVFNANTKHIMELVDRRKTLPNGEVVDIYIPASNNPNRRTYSTVLQDSPIENLNRFQLGLVPMIGGNIYFTDKFICSPSFSYYTPFKNLVTTTDLSVSAWRLNVEFKYNLATEERIYRSPKKKPTVVRRR